VFTAGRDKVADARQVVRSFAIARFYLEKERDAIVKAQVNVAYMPSFNAGRVMDPAVLMTQLPGPTLATGLSWMPGQSISVFGADILKFKDSLSEEVLMHFNGGRRVFHPGMLNLEKLTNWSTSGPRPGMTAFRSKL
jgi:hypothetical protein